MGAVGVLRLPLVAQLGDRARLALRDEDRVIAEAVRAAALVPDRPLERSTAAYLGPVGEEAHELAYIARAAVGLALELAESRSTLLPGLPQRAEWMPGRPYSAAASIPESSPSTGSFGASEPAAEAGLDQRVLVVGGAIFERILIRLE